MTFENRKLTEQKPVSETRTGGGLIHLNQNQKESNSNSNEIDSSTRQFYNQTRKKQTNKRDLPANQPQSITQSSRGLTNVTRTLYDPNAATTPKHPPVSVIQPTTTTTTVKAISNPVSSPPVPPPPTSAPTPLMNTPPMQEFHQQ